MIKLRPKFAKNCVPPLLRIRKTLLSSFLVFCKHKVKRLKIIRYLLYVVLVCCFFTCNKEGKMVTKTECDNVHISYLESPDMTLTPQPGSPKFEPLHKNLSPVSAAPSPPLQLCSAALLAEAPGRALAQGLPQGRCQAVVAPGGAHPACCSQGHRGQQPQDLVGDVEGEQGERVGAA